MAINTKSSGKLSPEAISRPRIGPRPSSEPHCLDPGDTLSNCLQMDGVNE